MTAEPREMSGAEPFFFEGGPVGCLVCHGFTGTPQSVRPLGRLLAERGGCTVIGPRLAGHGTRSEDLASARAASWVGDVEEAFEVLGRRCTQIFVAGLSLGGTLALHLAARHRERVAGVIPINAPLFVANPELAGLVFAPNSPRTLPGIGSDIKKPGVSELAYPDFPAAVLPQVFALLGVVRELLPTVTSPTLIFQSREDHVVPPANGPFLLERLGAADKELVWLEDSYHVATLDNDQPRIGDRILGFLRRHA